MRIEKEYRTKLAVGDLTIDRRDIEMLEAIDRHGSMHGAADALERSYARLQNRVVEIEDALGPITERRRGGPGGGGTELTETARDLCQQFDRHNAELDGVARVTESVFEGHVSNQIGELATVETPIGAIVALAPDETVAVQVTVRSDAVVLTDPDESPGEDETSLRNQFTGTVSALEPGAEVTGVTIGLEGERELRALVTRASADRLNLTVGEPITAAFKATAARAVPADTA
ncbi:LysR family transcriptional regulator [Salinadaptatus halalkaliphilus]|uniref:LysR family transcriptional regulator n=1 Tax=Salinadaptatus halalkaliphilus TaxID=2419781 RepID=A0A4S3TLR8_9EURY|nr:TOBE domain-containing protein [Salinadaptatus halalkaliphilus]THE64193.1 LysR family transcriptional regulator [Salinadaptatus halalkaliphilus]